MINYDLSQIRAFVFDVDGVLSTETITLDNQGVPLRSVNIKDGYALQLAVKMGFHIAIITGAAVDAIRVRYQGLGIQDVHLGASMKVPLYEAFLHKYGLHHHQVLYMGDDIPDLPVMRRVGCPCCPADAAPDVVETSIYVSHRAGGMGCCRDVVEQVMRAQGKWMSGDKAFGW